MCRATDCFDETSDAKWQESSNQQQRSQLIKLARSLAQPCFSAARNGPSFARSRSTPGGCRAGIAYSKRDVLVVRVLDEPGMLGDLALVMAKAGINIDSVCVTTRGHIVLGVDDLAGAIQVAAGHGGHGLRVSVHASRRRS